MWRLTGPRADGAAAGERDHRLAEACEHRPQDQDRGPHRLHELVGGEQLANRRAVDLDVHALVHHQLHPHAAEQLHGGGDVLQVGDVSHLDRAVGEQGGGEDRQRGVLGARDADLAFEGDPAGDDELIHSARAGGPGEAARDGCPGAAARPPRPGTVGAARRPGAPRRGRPRREGPSPGREGPGRASERGRRRGPGTHGPRAMETLRHRPSCSHWAGV